MSRTQTRGTLVGLLAGLLVGLLLSGLPARSDEGDELMAGFFEPVAWLVQQIEARSVNEADHKELLEGAYMGMASRLDRYSAYWPPNVVDEFEADLEGEFGGLGIQITFDPVERVIHVAQPIAGTPAARQGVLAGDLIVRVRQEPAGEVTEVEDLENVHEVLAVLRGKVGAQVTITVLHGEDGESEDITISRELIKIPGVRAVEIVDPEGRIGYIYVPYFGKPMLRDLKRAMGDLRSQGAEGFILDLRLNPGGLLDAAKGMADLFLSGGTIVTVRGRMQGVEVHRAHRWNTFSDVPLVVLLNRGSASGAEIVAAALRDHGRAVIVGEHSFGKASVQTVIHNPYDDSTFKMTVARYYTPNGQMIEGQGVKPHIEVKLSDEDTRRLTTYLSNKTEYPAPPPEDASPEPAEAEEGDEAAGEPGEPEEPFHDRQLERAVEVMNDLLAGRWPPDAAPEEAAVPLAEG